MSLTFDDEKMEIYPTTQDLESTVLEILAIMTNTLQVKHLTRTARLFKMNAKSQVLAPVSPLFG